MRFPSAALALLFSVALPAFGADPAAPTALFDGKDLLGWSLITPAGADIGQVCRVTPEGTIAVAGKPNGYLQAPGSYQNYKLHVEWRWPANASAKSNGGILMHITGGPADKNKTFPTCLQVQLKIHHAGDLIPMVDAKFAEPLSTPPGAATKQLNMGKPDSEKPFGEWNSADILCRDGVIECVVNGVAQNRVSQCQPASGQIGFQLEGTPFELRNIRIEP